MNHAFKTRFATASVLALLAGIANADVTLSFLVDNGASTVAMAEALAAAYTAEHPDVTFDIESRPGGGEGDNIVKTRLATGEMADVFLYNSGSLFQALNPTQTLVPLDDLAAQANIIDSFKTVVTAEGSVYGIPIGTAMGGGILYNIPMYEELGLSIPHTWDEFMANNAAILAAGKVPVAQTYGATWTSQLFVLSDYYNVAATVPDFADQYTANAAKYATTPAAMKGFNHLQEV